MAAEFASLRCACGFGVLISITPGYEPQRRGAVDLFTRVDPLVDIGAPTIGRCRACFMARYPGLNSTAVAHGH